MTTSRVQLREIAQIDVGFPFKSAFFTSNSEDIRLLRGDNIGQGRLRWKGVARWPADAPVSSNFSLVIGDIVVAMDRPWISAGLKFACLKSEDLPAYLVQRVARLRVKNDHSQGYLAALVSSRSFADYLMSIQTGTAVPHISARQIGSFRFNVPPLTVQITIADMLAAINDKIETNRYVAETSGALTRALYGQVWSTRNRLHWSSNENVIIKFEDFALIGGGGTPRTSVEEYWSGGVPWATPTDVTALDGPYLEATARRISDAGLAACSSPLYPAGSILMTSRATIGAFAVAEQPMAVNQGFIVVQPHDERLKWWIFHEMQSRVDEFVSHANGATFLELSRGKFKQFPVRLADEATMYKFNDEAAALHDVARAALRENVTLAALRDTLLPELMSGRMRVRDAEERVGEVL